MENQEDLRKILSKTKKILWKFTSRIDVKDKDSCWEWIGSKEKGGYGIFYYHGANKLAHRFSWEVLYGKIPKRMVICHKCDNPSCVNPNHLFLGTQEDNLRDMHYKGRAKPPPKRSC